MARHASKIGLAFLGLFLGCGGGEALPTPVTPSKPVAPEPTARKGDPLPTTPTQVASADPWALPEAGDEDPAPAPATMLRLDVWERAIKAKGVAAPPASCAAVAKAVPANAPRVDLAPAADRAPIECADMIIDPHLKPTAGVTGEVAHNLVGLSLASKLARTASTPPSMAAIREKEAVRAFIGGPLKSWVVEQATAIELLSSGAAGLVGYGRGIAAIEAGVAELRLVDKLRSAPVPASWDAELKSVYEAALDDALEPRKRRGRDAALVGMSDFAAIGILRHPSLTRARTLLAKLYGGRRIDALDVLLSPSLPSPPLKAAFLPAIDGNEVIKDVSLLAVVVPHELRGNRNPMWKTEHTPLLARARLEMGRIYWRRVDFVAAAHAAKASTVPEDRLVLALALALVHAPNGAAAMMSAPSPTALDLGHTEALDSLASDPKTAPPLAGMAAFDAAHLRSLSPPEGADAPAYLRDVAARFKKAESLLTDPEQKKRAAERAKEADAIANAAEKKK